MKITKEQLKQIIKEELETVMTEATRSQWWERFLYRPMKTANTTQRAKAVMADFVMESWKAKELTGMGQVGRYMSIDKAKEFDQEINKIDTLARANEVFVSISGYFDADMNKVDKISDKLLGKSSGNTSSSGDEDYKPPTAPFQGVEDDAPSRSFGQKLGSFVRGKGYKQ